jgi:pyridoxamine 5'-phosphate oxidase
VFLLSIRTNLSFSGAIPIPLSRAGEITSSSRWIEKNQLRAPKSAECHLALPVERIASQNETMPQTLWRPSLVLAIYLNRHAPASRFVQMATVCSDGRPANRTLVFRGFLNETSRLTFAADQRSHKIVELAGSPRAEVCWYFPVTHEQFRIAGVITPVSEDTGDAELSAARRECWRTLPESTRASFTWPAPGQPRVGAIPFPREHPDPENPLPHFGLLVLDPQAVDCLEINGHPQNRWQFHRNEQGRWSGIEVNP